MRMAHPLAAIGLMLASLAQPAAPARAAQAVDRPVIDAILHAEREVCAAFERGDADWLERHLAPDFTLTGSTGEVTTREDEVASLRNGTRYAVFRNHDTQVRVYGDAAVTTGFTRVQGEGESSAMEFRFTDTWIRTPQGWTLVASHASRAAP